MDSRDGSGGATNRSSRKSHDLSSISIIYRKVFLSNHFIIVTSIHGLARYFYRLSCFSNTHTMILSTGYNILSMILLLFEVKVDQKEANEP